jgi:hypothetical protein
MLSIDCTCNNVHILPLAEHARKFIPSMLSMRWNRFRVCSACDKIVSTYAQHTHAIIFENDSKNPNYNANFAYKKIEILKNRLGTHLIGPKWRFVRKNFFGYLSKKIWFRVCSVTAEMFDHRNSGENRRKRREILFEIYEGHRSKKFQLSHACVPLKTEHMFSNPKRLFSS